MQLLPQDPLPAPHRTTGLQITTGNYRLTPVMTGKLPASTILHGFHYKQCLPLPAIYRQGWSIYHRLPPVMENYRHAGKRGNAILHL